MSIHASDASDEDTSEKPVEKDYSPPTFTKICQTSIHYSSRSASPVYSDTARLSEHRIFRQNIIMCHIFTFLALYSMVLGTLSFILFLPVTIKVLPMSAAQFGVMWFFLRAAKEKDFLLEQAPLKFALVIILQSASVCAVRVLDISEHLWQALIKWLYLATGTPIIINAFYEVILIVRSFGVFSRIKSWVPYYYIYLNLET